MRRDLVVLLAPLWACVGPRGAILGQPASMLGHGAEVGVSGGGLFSPSMNQQQPNLVEAPRLEAAVRGAIGDSLELQLHLASQGIRPAVKFGFSGDSVDFAVLPSFGAGYYSFGSTVTGPASTGQTLGNLIGTKSGEYQLTFSAGLSAMLSARGAAYVGLSYLFTASDLGGISFSPAASGQMSVSPDDPPGGHQVAVLMGWDVQFGKLSLRPEAGAFAFFPSGARTSTEGGPRIGCMATLTVALATATR